MLELSSKKVVKGTDDIPRDIFKTSVRLAWTLLSSSDHNFSSFNLCSYGIFFKSGNILGNRCCTFSNNSLSLMCRGNQADIEYSRWGLTNDLYRFSSIYFTVPDFYNPDAQLCTLHIKRHLPLFSREQKIIRHSGVEFCPDHYWCTENFCVIRKLQDPVFIPLSKSLM